MDLTTQGSSIVYIGTHGSWGKVFCHIYDWRAYRWAHCIYWVSSYVAGFGYRVDDVSFFSQGVQQLVFILRGTLRLLSSTEIRSYLLMKLDLFQISFHLILKSPVTRKYIFLNLVMQGHMPIYGRNIPCQARASWKTSLSVHKRKNRNIEL